LAQKLAGAGRADKKGTLSMENLSRATAAVNALPVRLAGQHDVAATQFGEYRTITKTGGNRIGSGRFSWQHARAAFACRHAANRFLFSQPDPF
jgi:hypothetical protein